MFKKIKQGQKTKLHTKAKQYLDQYMKDQISLQKTLNNGSTHPSTLMDSSALEDFEYKADPQKFLDEIEKSLKNHKDLA